MASVGLVDPNHDVCDMDGRDDAYEFFAKRTPWKSPFLGYNALPHLYESSDSP